MTPRWTVGVLLIAAGVIQPTVRVAGMPAQAATDTLVLVELFTSEGCSSCPPADALLRDLLAAQPVNGARIVPMSEHVDYWNQLGWTDPFSAAQYSQRQQDYAGTLKTRDVYTPQLVVDGTDAFVGSDRTRALAAIRAAVARKKGTIELAWSDATHRSIEIRTTPAALVARSAVFLAITEDGLRISVRRGENQGRELAHDGVTRYLSTLGSTDGSGTFHRTVVLPTDRAWRLDRQHLVAFAQRDSAGVVAIQTMNR